MKKKILKINGHFELPDYFKGKVSNALRLLAHYLDSEEKIDDKKLQAEIEILEISKAGMVFYRSNTDGDKKQT